MLVTASPVETPSGKDAASENFPVGSWLIAKRYRPHVAVFYAFARAIDDIADSPLLSADEKLKRLDGFSAVLSGQPVDNPAGFQKALDLRQSLLETGVADSHCQDLITAFRQDAIQNRYESWEDLMAYCRLSAAPVGRYLIDLHSGGVPSADYDACDALCLALQVINHVQDCKDDFLTLDRVYLPQDWMAAENLGCESLNGVRASAGLRRVLDRVLEATDALLDRAQALPSTISDRRLAMEASVIGRIARALCVKLRHHDPLERRVVLSAPSLLWCTVSGVAGAMGRRGMVPSS